MLKIKDNIDLKELEKYGFKKHKRDDKYVVVSKWAMERIYDEESLGVATIDYSLHSFPIIELIQTGKGLKIDLVAKWDFVEKALETIYDLIKAGLVEKE